MKNTFKTKLRLNSQTLRSLRTSNLKAVQGGMPMLEDVPQDDTVNCTNFCSGGCRGCG